MSVQILILNDADTRIMVMLNLSCWLYTKIFDIQCIFFIYLFEGIFFSWVRNFLVMSSNAILPLFHYLLTLGMGTSSLSLLLNH